MEPTHPTRDSGFIQVTVSADRLAVEFVESIPRNPTGKVLKRILRDQFPGPAAE